MLTVTAACLGSALPIHAQDKPVVSGGFEDEGLVLPDRQTLDAAQPARVRIDPHAPGHPVYREILGTNQSWYWSEHFAGEGPGVVNPEYVAVMEGLPMPLARMSGTGSQMFNWRQAVGPLADRTPQKVRDFDKQPTHVNFGPLEWVDAMLQHDPDTAFAWVLNLREDLPQDHGDLAELLVGVVGENRNGGKDWAQVRADYGYPDPVNVHVWELGNEDRKSVV